MKKHLLPFIGISLLVLSSCQMQSFVSADIAVGKSITKVESFPDIPANYNYFDYKTKALALDDTTFSFAQNEVAQMPNYISTDMSTWSPVGFWIDQVRQPTEYLPLETGYLKRSFGLPTYVGDNRVASSGSEAMTTIASVLGSSFAGIDKSAQAFGETTDDFVEMTFSSYDTGSKLVHNFGLQGQSFWYDIFPQIMFTRLYDMYPDTLYMKEMVLNGADQWLEALPYFVDDTGAPDYDFVGYNVVLESPTITGNHIEPPNGGLAFLFYAAYEMTQEGKYLQGAKEVLDYLQSYPGNPNYEALTDYAPFVAAAMNAKYGTTYDVGKFLDFLFDGDSSFRTGWSVLSGNFGNYAVDGLVGQTGDYAFAMNSLHLATVLAPLVKYDVRYASAIGKYLLNLVNNAQVFFPQEITLGHQSMADYLPFDKAGSLLYEGFRNNYNSVSGYAMGDATAMFGQPSDLSVYSSAFIGGLGALVAKTNVKGILQVNLDSTDSFGQNEYPNYLYYNPFATEKIIDFDGGLTPYDLYDTITKAIVAHNVTGVVHLKVPANSSKVVMVLPANSTYSIESGCIVINDKTVSRLQAAVNLTNIATRQELTAATDIGISYSAPKNDVVTAMKISFGPIVVYDGEPVMLFNYDKALLPDTDYTMKVEITTQNGLVDYVTKRVVCR